MTTVHNRKRKIPNRQAGVVALAIAALATTGTLGWLGLRQAQIKKIGQAQTVLTQACQTDLAPNTNPSTVVNQVNQATSLLESIPNLPGLPYPKAQQQLTDFAACLKRVQAANHFFNAQQMSQPAMAGTESTILSATDWRERASDLEQAIALLKNIPPDVPLYNQAQTTLKTYQAKLGEINQRLQTEVAATTAFQEAQALSGQAEQLLQGSPSAESLNSAALQFQDAIERLNTIPAGTTVSEQSKQLLTVNQQRLEDIRYRQAVQALNALVEDFANFAARVDVTLGYLDYSEQLHALRDEFSTVIQTVPASADLPAASALRTALEQYNDALVVWRHCHEGNCYNSLTAGIPDFRQGMLWLPASFQIGDSLLLEKYPMETTTNLVFFNRQQFVQLNQALATIWQKAEQSIEQAKQ
jgi:hypothetical protein